MRTAEDPSLEALKYTQSIVIICESVYSLIPKNIVLVYSHLWTCSDWQDTSATCGPVPREEGQTPSAPFQLSYRKQASSTQSI